MTIIVILVVIVLLVIWGISIYNNLVKLRNNRENAFANIDVQLKQRHDLIPQLVATVKGYAQHEKELLERVTQARAAAMSGKVKDLFDDPAGFLVDHDLVFRVGVFFISERRIGCCSFPGCVLGFQCGLDLSAGVLGKPLVEQVLEGNEIAQAFFCILVLCDGDVADVLFREHEFQIIIHHHMLTAKAGKVFCDNAVDLSGLYIVHHAFEVRTLKIGSAPSVVYILVNHMEIVVACELSEDRSLRLYGNAVAVFLIITAESHV